MKASTVFFAALMLTVLLFVTTSAYEITKIWLYGSCINDTCSCFEGRQGPNCYQCGSKIRLETPQGIITDGPENYFNNIRCSWLIEAEGFANATIRLHFEEFDTECGWDNFYIYDGDSVDSPLLAVFSGLMYKKSYAVRSVPEVIAKSGSVLLHFASDDAYNTTGFRISYAINSCPSNNSSTNCSGNGICENSICTCHDGWIGKACNYPACPGNCSYSLQRGICDEAAQTCLCQPGIGGHDCSQPIKHGIWERVEMGQFKPAGSASHSATVWNDSLYIVSGVGFESLHLMYTYNFNYGVWDIVNSSSNLAPNHRYGASAVNYGDKIFLYGGIVTDRLYQDKNNIYRDFNKGFNSDLNKITDELWVFHISANTWENIDVIKKPCDETIDMCGPLQSIGHTATVVQERMIVIFGYSSQFGYLNTVQEYNFDTREWVIVQTQGYPVKGGYGHTAAYDPFTEKIYVHGGIVPESSSNQIITSNLYSYDPANKIWKRLAQGPGYRFFHSANIILPGMMIVFGGNTYNKNCSAKCYSNELLAYDVVCDSWNYLTIPLHLRDNLARYGHSGTVFKNSLYLYGGFDGQMLNDMIRFMPGYCHHLPKENECLNSKIGVKCFWDASNHKCYNTIEVRKGVLKNSEFDLEPYFIECFVANRSTMIEKRQFFRDRCTIQTDCKSCVQTSYNCVWCPNGVCSHKRCRNLDKHMYDPFEKINVLEDCPFESGPVCAQKNSCKACIKTTLTSHISSNAIDVVPIQCYWDYETGKCKAGNNSISESQRNEHVCTASCADFTSCTNCTQEECIWCQNEARCVDKNAYTVSFPYGQCREWTTSSNRCRIPPNFDDNIDDSLAGSNVNKISSCSAYASCSDCREDPACGWCDNGSRTGLGICLPGGAGRPKSPFSCLHHNWYFTQCPSCQCNGHSTCLENSSVCIQPCGNLTIGQHCEKCSPGYWGNPLNGGKCQPCECNDQATLCNPDSGKCYCTTKGLAGDRCDKCDATNRYHSDPTNKEFCYYDLAVDFQFTFNLSKKEDRHFTQINFRNSPTKPDIDADFSISCSVLAKMNITVRTANEQEKTIFSSLNCTTFTYRFAEADYNFGVEDNVPLTTFFIRLYDFRPPLWFTISFIQFGY